MGRLFCKILAVILGLFAALVALALDPLEMEIVLACIGGAVAASALGDIIPLP